MKISRFEGGGREGKGLKDALNNVAIKFEIYKQCFGCRRKENVTEFKVFQYVIQLLPSLVSFFFFFKK